MVLVMNMKFLAASTHVISYLHFVLCFVFGFDWAPWHLHCILSTVLMLTTLLARLHALCYTYTATGQVLLAPPSFAVPFLL